MQSLPLLSLVVRRFEMLATPQWDQPQRVSSGDLKAMGLEIMLVTRHPEEIFAAEDRFDWDDWVEFFSRTREPDGRRKGLVEVVL